MFKFPGDLSFLADPFTFKQWLYHEVPQKWVVFSKPPFAGPEEEIKYIGHYTHRTAISNNRIITEKDGQIEFWFKNTKKKARWETTSLPVTTFIDRFLPCAAKTLPPNQILRVPGQRQGRNQHWDHPAGSFGHWRPRPTANKGWWYCLPQMQRRTHDNHPCP